eukprot:5774009-Pleurochrysis_carterae.AAC.1
MQSGHNRAAWVASKPFGRARACENAGGTAACARGWMEAERAFAAARRQTPTTGTEAAATVAGARLVKPSLPSTAEKREAASSSGNSIDVSAVLNVERVSPKKSAVAAAPAEPTSARTTLSWFEGTLPPTAASARS